MNTMLYRGYVGSVEFSREDRILFGYVLGLERHLISFEGESIAELEKDFHNAVDHYLEICGEEGIAPEKPRAAKASSEENPRFLKPRSAKPRARKRKEPVEA